MVYNNSRQVLHVEGMLLARVVNSNISHFGRLPAGCPLEE